MKLAKEVLLEIVAVIQDALLKGKDASENMRQLDIVVGDDELILSEFYKMTYPRATVWPDETDDFHETDAIGDGSLS